MNTPENALSKTTDDSPSIVPELGNTEIELVGDCPSESFMNKVDPAATVPISGKLIVTAPDDESTDKIILEKLGTEYGELEDAIFTVIFAGSALAIAPERFEDVWKKEDPLPTTVLLAQDLLLFFLIEVFLKAENQLDITAPLRKLFVRFSSRGQVT